MSELLTDTEPGGDSPLNCLPIEYLDLITEIRDAINVAEVLIKECVEVVVSDAKRGQACLNEGHSFLEIALEKLNKLK